MNMNEVLQWTAMPPSLPSSLPFWVCAGWAGEDGGMRLGCRKGRRRGKGGWEGEGGREGRKGDVSESCSICSLA